MTPDPPEPHNPSLTRLLDEIAVKLIRRGRPRTERQALHIYDRVYETAAEFEDAPIQAYVPVLVENLVRREMAAADPGPASSPAGSA